MNRKVIVGTMACLAAAALGLSGCAPGGGSGESGDKYRVALSMSYSGNDWQSTSRNLIEAAAKSAPLQDRVSSLDVSVAGTDAQAQIAQLQQMIAGGYNAIIVYPISPTALNPTIKQACDAGIVVVAYDAQVTEPCAYNVSFDQKEMAATSAGYLADLMGDEGNVVMISGVSGTTVDTDRNDGARAVFEERGINVLDQCEGQWAAGPSGECMSRLLAAFPDIDGVWAQTGGIALTSAFDSANRPYVPIISEAENSWRLALVDPTMTAKGLKGGSMGAPQYQGAAALQQAVAILDGETRDHFTDVGYDWVTQEQIKKCDTGSVEELEGGCNVFPAGSVSDSFFADWYSSDYTAFADLQTALTAVPAQ
ncbi:substrate-binding domain-containing protein [Microbacterium testaceum]|uniref:substrate-binding domain-containing protein n=1 Tax=Microbacterium testaceum TaxID=2033 RepID=UPI00177AB345|nr:substrate-binding domain-containing protein [Microbacterium testaceum]